VTLCTEAVPPSCREETYALEPDQPEVLFAQTAAGAFQNVSCSVAGQVSRQCGDDGVWSTVVNDDGCELGECSAACEEAYVGVCMHEECASHPVDVVGGRPLALLTRCRCSPLPLFI
jgi:hypothetical protein